MIRYYKEEKKNYIFLQIICNSYFIRVYSRIKYIIHLFYFILFDIQLKNIKKIIKKLFTSYISILLINDTVPVSPKQDLNFILVYVRKPFDTYKSPEIF